MSGPVERTPVLQACRIRKQFGTTVSLDDVSLEIHGGRILALLGDNGAGKSTLVKILCGVLQPDSGEFKMNGEPIVFGNPSHARRQGIATVFQDLAVCPMMSITRNVVLGNEPLKGGGLFDGSMRPGHFHRHTRPLSAWVSGSTVDWMNRHRRSREVESRPWPSPVQFISARPA